MNAQRSLCLAAELKNLVVIRDFVRASTTALGVDQEVISDVVLAVDEAVTNVIVHGYRGRPGTIQVEVTREATDVVVRLRDHALPFDPTGARPPDLARPLEERPPGGLGIYLMRQYMDEVAYRLTPQGGNELILKKKLSTARSKQ
jgi:serine/threonine-protein kinase RsbW